MKDMYRQIGTARDIQVQIGTERQTDMYRQTGKDSEGHTDRYRQTTDRYRQTTDRYRQKVTDSQVETVVSSVLSVTLQPRCKANI